jgi:pimeloyl-ACP methyl ester carboxylesterase
MTERLYINGVELAWHDQGTGPGPTLVLCHGYAGSSLDFSIHVDALSANRRVVSLDQRGHGNSTNTGDVASYTIDQLVDDLVGFIEKVSDGPVDLLGHSMGGRVALGVVLARPDLIHSLILMDTSAWSFLPTDEGLRQLVHDFMTAFDPTRGVPSTLSLRGPEDDLIDAAMSAEWRAEKQRMYESTDAYAIKAFGMTMLAEDAVSVRSRLSSITCPTTVLVGSKDHPLVGQAPELAAELAHGHLVVIDGAYHSPQLTHPDEWRAAVEGHLAHSHDSHD